ncbi:helix-turn-helix transcriptional regulator [Rhodococcus qingshengii]|jgi:transcriptional regulator with XRE-family HTH domain|uniref:helix-turn-helix domain-containing protein n=1 Tax=Rhodococcus qingshengii TaxID=334542 RepID=UPI0024BA1FDC|nr:helix-turn-helix transcriptional regulator [Rhodococcus qingshengii]MDJ0489105.1 helix-turn-helix transcriptional regulator [Rhodococcus qingshengii]
MTAAKEFQNELQAKLDEVNEKAAIDQVATSFRYVRKHVGLSQTEVIDRLNAVGINFTQEVMSRIEHGTRQLRFIEAVWIAEVLGIDISILAESVTTARRADLLAHVNRQRIKELRAELAALESDLEGGLS